MYNMIVSSLSYGYKLDRTTDEKKECGKSVNKDSGYLKNITVVLVNRDATQTFNTLMIIDSVLKIAEFQSIFKCLRILKAYGCEP